MLVGCAGDVPFVRLKTTRCIAAEYWLADVEDRDLAAGPKSQDWPPRAGPRRDVEPRVAMLLQAGDPGKHALDDEVERDNLPVVSVAGQHQIDACISGRFEAIGTVIEQHLVEVRAPFQCW